MILVNWQGLVLNWENFVYLRDIMDACSAKFWQWGVRLEVQLSPTFCDSLGLEFNANDMHITKQDTYAPKSNEHVNILDWSVNGFDV